MSESTQRINGLANPLNLSVGDAVIYSRKKRPGDDTTAAPRQMAVVSYEWINDTYLLRIPGSKDSADWAWAELDELKAV